MNKTKPVVVSGKFRDFITDLNELAKNSGKKKLVVAVAQDEHCLEAICAVDKMGLVEAILVGNEKTQQREPIQF